MTFPMLTKTAVAVAAFASLSAQAFPIATPGTEGLPVIASGGVVTATYQGNSASYSNDLFLLVDGVQQFVFNNHANAVGDTAVLGTFSAGTELQFLLFVNNTEQGYFTGPASRNPDQHEHARVQENWQPGSTLVSFEDLFNGPFDYNDLSFSFTNTVTTVSEPQTLALMFAGLGVVGMVARRRRR